MWATRKLGEKIQTSVARKRKQNLYSQKRVSPKRRSFKSRLRQGARLRQTFILHVPRARYIPLDEGLSYLPRLQKENEPETKPAAKSTHSNLHPQTSLRTNITTLTPNINLITTDILHHIISHTTTPTYKPNSHNPANNHLPYNTPANNIPRNKHPASSIKNRTK
jgi:hypothetical protein